MSKPEPFDIDANPADADWLHQGPPRYKHEENDMSTPANPGSGVGNVHKPSAGAIKVPPKKPVKKPTKKK